MSTIGTEEARKLLPELLERAFRHGETTVITKRGVPYAQLAPLKSTSTPKPESLTQLRGSGQGCYRDAALEVRESRDVWTD
jgi:antitoxin (DNA-binding transcriptional repressor) of toxin-antitoxin stability system